MERRRKAPMLLFVILAAMLGLIAGYSLAPLLDLGAVKIRESPFGPEPGLRIPRGRDFGGQAELGALPQVDQERFLRSERLLQEGKGAQALDLLASLRKD